MKRIEDIAHDISIFLMDSDQELKKYYIALFNEYLLFKYKIKNKNIQNIKAYGMFNSSSPYFGGLYCESNFIEHIKFFPEKLSVSIEELYEFIIYQRKMKIEKLKNIIYANN